MTHFDTDNLGAPHTQRELGKDAPDLTEARGHLDGVTEGPWNVVLNRRTWGWMDIDGPSFRIGAPIQATDLTADDEVQRLKDASFIAYARNNWSSLIDRAEAAEQALDAERAKTARLVEALVHLRGAFDCADVVVAAIASCEVGK